jgi:hypothetical protein
MNQQDDEVLAAEKAYATISEYALIIKEQYALLQQAAELLKHPVGLWPKGRANWYGRRDRWLELVKMEGK